MNHSQPENARSALSSSTRPLGFLWESFILGGLAAALLLLALIDSTLPAALSKALYIILPVLSMGLIIFRYQYVNKNLITPLNDINEWAEKVVTGRVESRLQNREGNYGPITNNVNTIANKLEDLTLHMDEHIKEHTEHIEKKNHTLEIVYDVAASINLSRDLDDLLTRFLETLKNVVNAKAAVVRLVTEDGQMRMVASLGLDEDLMEREQTLPSEQCLCGAAYRDGAIYQQDIRKCDKILNRAFFDDSDIAMIAVPLQYREKILGVYNLYVDNEEFADPEDITVLLTNIGRHLGMAIDKARSEDESNRLSIMEERTRLAHELHDSLAQTLASLRFQVRVLDETLRQGQEPAIWHEMEKIENNLDEAYAELRELITHFRAPIDKRGLIPAVEHLVERFRNQSDISIFLQKEWNVLQLPASIEVQALRIIQEALNNIRKHSQAHAVRVILRSDVQGDCHILIEDDGVGMHIAPQSDRTSGDHLGLSIMEERAKRIGGTVNIESEPHEGTRIFLRFRYPEVNVDEAPSLMEDE
ncbi:MAG: histidine kinase [Gammaproteobacteria bacterium]|nr:histidine kinase [Gammaproteobacteria bacterium]